MAGGHRQKGLDNMKQISTGAGLVALSVGMVATAIIATHRGNGQAFAQGTGTERRIVSAGVYGAAGGVHGLNAGGHWAFRVWSDNTTEVKYLGDTSVEYNGNGDYTGDYPVFVNTMSRYTGHWQAVDSGTSAFFTADVDRSQQVDTGDISAVLLDFGSRIDEAPPPPIDCTVNQVK